MLVALRRQEYNKSGWVPRSGWNWSRISCGCRPKEMTFGHVQAKLFPDPRHPQVIVLCDVCGAADGVAIRNVSEARWLC